MAKTKQNKHQKTKTIKSLLTNLCISEEFFHRVIFGVADSSHPLNALTCCESSNLPKASSKLQTGSSHTSTWGACEWPFWEHRFAANRWKGCSYCISLHTISLRYPIESQNFPFFEKEIWLVHMHMLANRASLISKHLLREGEAGHCPFGPCVCNTDVKPIGIES